MDAAKYASSRFKAACRFSDGFHDHVGRGAMVETYPPVEMLQHAVGAKLANEYFNFIASV